MIGSSVQPSGYSTSSIHTLSQSIPYIPAQSQTNVTLGHGKDRYKAICCLSSTFGSWQCATVTRTTSGICWCVTCSQQAQIECYSHSLSISCTCPSCVAYVWCFKCVDGHAIKPLTGSSQTWDVTKLNTNQCMNKLLCKTNWMCT